MGAVWSALLVGGGLAGALILWLLRGDPVAQGKDGGAEPQKNAPSGQAEAPGGGPGGGGSGSLSSEPFKRQLVSKPGILPPRLHPLPPGAPADVPGVLKFFGEGEMTATWSCSGGSSWTSFPVSGLNPPQAPSLYRPGEATRILQRPRPAPAAPAGTGSSAWRRLAQCRRLA